MKHLLHAFLLAGLIIASAFCLAESLDSHFQIQAELALDYAEGRQI